MTGQVFFIKRRSYKKLKRFINRVKLYLFPKRVKLVALKLFIKNQVSLVSFKRFSKCW